MTEIISIKEGSLAANAWRRGAKEATRARPPIRVVTPERDGHRVGCERQSLPRPNVAGGHVLTLIMDGSPDRSGRRSKGSYVPSESEDIDLK